MSKLLRRLLYLLGALAILYVAVVAVMSTSWFHRILLRRVTTTLEDLTGARVEIGQLLFQPRIFQVTFLGLILHGTEHSPEPPLFSARTVVIGFNPASLLHRRLLLRSLDCQYGEVHIYRYPDGSINLPGPRRPGEPGHAWKDFMDLSIRNLRIVHSTLFWNDQRLPLELTAQDAAVMLRFSRGDSYSGSISSSELSLKGRGLPVLPISFATQIQFSSDHLEVGSLTWESAGITGCGSFTLHRLPSLKGQGSFQASGELPALARALRLQELKGGNFNWEGQASYRDGKLEAKGRVRAHQLMLRTSSFEPGRIDLWADYSADLRHLEVSNLGVSLLGGTAQGWAEVSFQGSAPTFVLRTQIHELDLVRALESFSSGPAVVGRLHVAAVIDGSANAVWSGRLKNFVSQFNFTFNPLSGGDAGSLPVLGFARGTAKIADGFVLELEDARLQTPHSSLTAHGTLEASQSSLAFQLSTSDFEEWRPLVEAWSAAPKPIPLALKSSSTFSGAVSGSVSRPQIRGRLKVGPFDYRGWMWDGFEANIVASPDLVQVSSGQLLGRNSALTFDASARLQDGRLTPQAPLHITAQAQRAPLEGLKEALNVRHPFSGFVTGRLDLDGTRSNLIGTGVLRVDHGMVAGEPVDSLSANIRAAGSTLDLENIQLVKGSGRATGQARVDLSTRAFSAALSGTDFSLAEFRQLAAPPQLQSKASTPEKVLEGRMNFNLRGEGTPGNIQIQSNLDIRDINLKGSTLGNFRGQLDWRRQQIQLEAESQGPGGNFNFTGHARTEGDWPFQLTAQYTNFRADPWIRLLRPGKFEAAITATGSMNVTGPLQDPSRSELRSRTQKLEVSLPDLSWKNDQPVELSFANRVLTISRFQLRGPSTNCQVEGSIRFAERAAVSINAQGQVDASLLTVLDPALLATGRFDLKFRASGSPKQPLLYGTVTVDNVSVGYPDLPLRLAGLKGELRLEGDRLTVTSLRGVSGQSSLTMSGFVSLSGTPRYDLRADLDQARIEYPIDFTSVLSGGVHLLGTGESGLLSGDIAVRQMFVSDDFNLLAWMAEFANPTAAQPSGVTSPLASKIRLDVQVASHPEVRLESRDLRLVADIDMSLRGTMANPVGFGNIHIRSGEALLRGNRYKFTRGDITMKNPFRTQAALDLEAQTRVQHYDLILTVTGPSDRPKIAYRSDPPLPSSDVLSLLALGYSRQEQEMSAGASQTLGTVGASALLSQALSSQVSGRVQRLFGVSRIKIDPYAVGPSNVAGARITVEQQITRDLTVTYVSNTAYSQQRIIRFDWDISEHAELIGERDQNGVLGLELRFRRRFK